MAEYTENVTAISNVTTNNYDAFIDVIAASGTSIFLTQVNVDTLTQELDDNVIITIVRKSASGSTPADGSPIALRPTAPAATATTKVKNGSTAFGTGTIVETVAGPFAVNGRTPFIWHGRIESDIAERLGVHVKRVGTGSTSVSTHVGVVWEE